MRAAVLTEFKKPLTIVDRARPVPGPSEVLIRVEACGVCHSDLHLAEGDWLSKVAKLPLILGHEVVGTVVEAGVDVRILKPGDRVGVPWIHWTCGECEFCREGEENLCTAQKITGVTVDGGFAEFLTAPAGHALPVPPSLGSVEAAPLFCAGVTVYRAIRKASVQKGQRVAVFGVGGLGHLAVQICRLREVHLTAVDVAEEKLRLAASLGADLTLNASTENVSKKMRSLGGVHCAIVTSASRAAYETAFSSLRRGGTLVVVGVPAEPLNFAAIAMVGGEYRILSSAVGTRRDVREALELAAGGSLRCTTEVRPMSEVNEVLGIMRRGTVRGRIVLTPQQGPSVTDR